MLLTKIKTARFTTLLSLNRNIDTPVCTQDEFLWVSAKAAAARVQSWSPGPAPTSLPTSHDRCG